MSDLNEYLADIEKSLSGLRGIYCLRDHGTGSAQYVGQANCIFTRYKQHIKQFDGTPKSKWIQNLLAFGEHPVVQVLEVISEGSMDDREKHWISEFFGKGEKTVNKANVPRPSPSGIGKTGYRFGDDTILLVQTMALIDGVGASSLVESIIWNEFASNRLDVSDALRAIFAKRGMDFDAILKSRSSGA